MKKVSFTIQSNVPVPKSHRRKYNFAETFAAMKPNDSFMVDTEGVRNQVLRYCQQHRIKVTSVKENGTGYRIWKLK